MKNLFLFSLLTLLTVSFGFSQDPGKDFKKAEKDLKKYYSDVGNVSILETSLELMNAAFESEELKNDPKSWLKRAKIFNEIANSEFKQKTLDPSYALSTPDAAVQAFNALKMVSELSDKKNDHKEMQNILSTTENHLNNEAIFAYQEKDYKNAFAAFSGSIKAYELLKAEGKDSRLDEEGLLTDQYFFAAVSGYYGGNYEESKPYLNKLIELDTDEPFVYKALYDINAESNPEEALKYLEQGRAKFPDSPDLLFSEINYYLSKGELEVLITKLEEAIAAEPDNTSVYNTTGSVYDQLHQKSFKDGDMEKSKEYFNKALEYFNETKKRDPENFDATYSMGALYYNKAATYVDKLNELANDLSPAGMKAYDATKAEMDDTFRQALPYFQQAEGINGSDMNTLIALKEIHARLDDIETSNKYKAKIEAAGTTQN